MKFFKDRNRIKKVISFAIIIISCFWLCKIDISTKKVANHVVLKGVKFRTTILSASEKHNVPPELIAAIIHAESNFNPNAKSYARAKGLMQINPPTQKFLGLKNPFDPHQNVDAGTKYLSYLLDKFDGQLKLAIAAYNAGPGAVNKHKGIPPYKETRKYVKKVMNYYANYRNQPNTLKSMFTWFDISSKDLDA